MDEITKELKQILKRDFNRKMVENIAFNTFDQWWDEQKLLLKVRLTWLYLSSSSKGLCVIMDPFHLVILGLCNIATLP